jgi:hypothetical protein
MGWFAGGHTCDVLVAATVTNRHISIELPAHWVLLHVKSLFGARRVGGKWGTQNSNTALLGTREMIAESAPRFQSKVRENYAVLLADQLKLKCQAIGRPKPYIHWYRNGLLVDDVAVCCTNYLFRNSLTHCPHHYESPSLHTAKPHDIWDACASTHAAHSPAQHTARTATHAIASGRALSRAGNPGEPGSHSTATRPLSHY